MDEDEIPLAGGNVNLGVVRVGATVRRAVGPNGATVHRFLLALERAGFAQAPRFLGLDAQGREVLSLVEGSATVPADLWENDAAVVAAAGMLRRLHDASAGFGEGEGWAYAYPDRARHEVVCHNDFAPYNMIFEGGVPVGIVDFDLVGPGPRVRDLAYLAYWLTPLSFAGAELAERTARQMAKGAPRLGLLLRAYGMGMAGGLPEMVSEVLHHMGRKSAAVAMVGPEAAGRLEEGGHLAHWRGEAEAFDANLERVRSCLR